ncbi:hypothetical protein GCM10027346_41360 [Hymenobacter seoulensis]
MGSLLPGGWSLWIRVDELLDQRVRSTLAGYYSEYPFIGSPSFVAFGLFAQDAMQFQIKVVVMPGDDFFA